MESKQHHTKEKILNVSYQLFTSRGYDKTPISLILEQANISKGGFYHYFKSKEDIIDLIARKQVDAIALLIHQIAIDTKKTAIEKFNLLIERINSLRLQNRVQLFNLYEGYMKTENLHLKNKIESYTLEKALPSYAKIIRQGIAEKVFHTSSPELAAETIIRMAPELRYKMTRLYLERQGNEQFGVEIQKIADYLEELIQKILGTQDRSLQISKVFTSFFLTT